MNMRRIHSEHAASGGGEVLPAVDAFLQKRLRGDGASVLLLAVDANYRDSLDVLRKKLPTLPIGTLGIDWPIYMNVFFWAYEDGKIAREISEQLKRKHPEMRDTECQAEAKDKARLYMREVLRSELVTQTLSKEETARAYQMADLMIAALDSGTRMVAYDEQERFADQYQRAKPYREVLNTEYNRFGTYRTVSETSPPAQTIKNHKAYLRANLEAIEKSHASAMEEIVEKSFDLLTRVKGQYEYSPEYLNHKFNLDVSWRLAEVQHWLSCDPPQFSPEERAKAAKEAKEAKEANAVKTKKTSKTAKEALENYGLDERTPYQRRLEALEKLAAIGRNREWRMLPDAYKALVFAAAAKPGHDSIVLSNIRNIDGIGADNGTGGIALSYGLLGEYLHNILQAEGVKSPLIHKGVTACSALMAHLENYLQDKVGRLKGKFSGEPLAAINTETGEEGWMPHPSKRPVSIEERQPKMPFGVMPWNRKEYRARQVDPLSNMEIRNAFKEVQHEMRNEVFKHQGTDTFEGPKVTTAALVAWNHEVGERERALEAKKRVRNHEQGWVENYSKDRSASHQDTTKERRARNDSENYKSR